MRPCLIGFPLLSRCLGTKESISLREIAVIERGSDATSLARGVVSSAVVGAVVGAVIGVVVWSSG